MRVILNKYSIFTMVYITTVGCDPNLKISTTGTPGVDPGPQDVQILGTDSITRSDTGSSEFSVTLNSKEAVSYRYDVVAGTDCSVANYSDWIPVETPIQMNLAGDQDYTLCVEGRNDRGIVQQEPTTFTWTKNGDFTTTLDGLPDEESNLTSLSVAVSGSRTIEYRYEILSAASDCSAVSFAGNWIAVDTPINETLGSDGTYTLCVQGRDDKAVEQDIPSSFTWIKDTVPPTSTSFSGFPTGTNNTTILDITIDDPEIAFYQYKVAADPLDCSLASGYSSDIPVTTKIQDDISGLSDGAIRLCVIGRDRAGNLQDVSSATEATWIKDSSIDSTPPVVDAGVDRSANSSITLNATASDDVAIQSYAWQQVAGPGTCTFTSAATEDTDVSCVGDGVYTAPKIM